MGGNPWKWFRMVVPQTRHQGASEGCYKRIGEIFLIKWPVSMPYKPGYKAGYTNSRENTHHTTHQLHPFIIALDRLTCHGVISLQSWIWWCCDKKQASCKCQHGMENEGAGTPAVFKFWAIVWCPILVSNCGYFRIRSNYYFLFNTYFFFSNCY